MNAHKIILTAAFAVLLTGCASTPDPTPELLNAREAFEQAKNDPEVLRYAASELDSAQSSLDAAAAAKNVDDMNSQAYVASTRVQIAQARARRDAAELKMDNLAEVKSRVQLEVRDAELRASREKLASLEAKETDRGTVVTLGNFLFVTGKSDLLPGALDSVNRLAEYLDANQRKTVIVEGHTDSTGGDALNLRLSQERADAVRTALIAEGIAARRIVATGLGSSKPVAPNDTAAGRQQNRRVEVIISN